jgi:branched-chain amino acid transport system substrate-binding protein
MKRSSILLHSCIAALAGSLCSAQAATPPLKIGYLTDMSGPSAIDDGPGGVAAARMAVADFGGEVLGRKIEIVTGDHQHKPDVAIAIAKKWYTNDGVDAIMDVNDSSVALAVQQLTRDEDHVLLITGAGSSQLTGKSCSPNGVQWLTDTYSLARAAVLATVQEDEKKWFFITSDYAFGHALQADATAALLASGGTVLGAATYPFGTTDFAAYLLRASASGADVLAFANSSRDMENAVKQAHEFGLKMHIVPLLTLLMDIHSVGLEEMQGAHIADTSYWDTTDAMKIWAKRFLAAEGHMPTSLQVDSYRAVMHYLQAVQHAGVTEGKAVVRQMEQDPIEDSLGKGGTIRKDGRVIRDLLYLSVKSPAESKYPWDYYRVLKTIPAADIYRPLSEGGCPLVNE